MHKISILSLIFLSAIYSQTYDIGDVVSLENQMSAYEVCYGDYPNDSLKLADFNGALNGGHHNVIFIDMSASW